MTTTRGGGATGATEAGMPGRWTITINGWRPTLDNELVYVHWAKARARKRADARLLTMAGIAHGVPRAIGRRRVALTIRQPRGRYPDDSAACKSLWDGLVSAGLLVDDSREWLEFVWPPTFERGPKGTVIVIEDI